MLRNCFSLRGIPALAALVGLAAPSPAWELGGPLYQRGLSHAYPASYYGYNLDDNTAGYYGGIRYQEYYAYGRGYGLANFPGPLPNPLWTPKLCWPSYHQATIPPSCPHAIPGPGPMVPIDPALQPGPLDMAAHLTIHVPADAQVWLEGAQCKQTGTERVFVSPPLKPGQPYTYEVRARWTDNGQERELSKAFEVRAGQRVKITFRGPTPEPETVLTAMPLLP